MDYLLFLAFCCQNTESDMVYMDGHLLELLGYSIYSSVTMQGHSHKEKSNLALQLWIRETSGRYIFEPSDTPKLIFIEFQTHPEGKNQVPLKN